MKKLALIVTTLATAAVAHAADKPARIETRSRIDKEVVLFVGDCKLNTQSSTDLDNNRVVSTGYSLDYHVCQAVVKYQVSVAGNGWNAKESVVPNSDQAPQYSQKTLTKEFAGSTTKTSAGAADMLDDLTRNAQAMNLCGQQKAVLVQQSQLDRQSETYKNCAAQ
jgi:hypothetical protein